MIDTITHGFRQISTWAIGRGAIILALAFASSLLGEAAIATATLPAIALAATSVILGGLLSYRLLDQAHRKREADVTKEFSIEVGALLGKAPELVTAEEVKMVAEGNKNIDFLPGNPVIKAAFEQNNLKHNLSVASRVAAIVVTLGAASLFFGPVQAFGDFLADAAQSAAKIISFAWEPMGVLLAAGSIYTITNYATEHALFDYSGLGKKTAYDYIVDIEKDVNRGKPITLERVFGILAKCNPALGEAIHETYGVNYATLPISHKFEALQRFGDVELVSQLAHDISNRQIRPQELAFIAIGQRSGVPRLTEPPQTTKEKVHERWQDVKHAVRRRFSKAETSMGAMISEEELHEHIQKAANDNEKAEATEKNTPLKPIAPDTGFVNKYSLEKKPAASHVAREVAKRESEMLLGHSNAL